MATITILAGGDVVEERLLSNDVVIDPEDADQFTPAVVETIEYDHTGQQSQITSECGETENRRESDDKPDITIDGILTKEQLEDIKALKEDQQLTLSSDIHSGEVFVKRTTISQESELVSITINGDESLAFRFQLQLKQ